MDYIQKNKNGHSHNNGHAINSPLSNGKSKANVVIHESNGNREKDLEQSKDKTVSSGEDNPKQDRKPGQINLEGVPIDRGWAWTVLAGCVFYMTIFGGLMRSFGVFFLQFQQRFQANASEVAFMSFIQNIVVSVTGLLVMTVGMKKFSCRTVVAIGGLFNAVGFLISGFAEDIRVFYFSHGFLCGAGMAMLHPPMLAMIGMYFNKHRGIANSIFTGSGAVGGLIFAPIVTTIFQEFGYTGALLLISGLLFNAFVSAALLRPPTWFTKQHKSGPAISKDGAREPLMSESNGQAKTFSTLANKANEQHQTNIKHEFEMQDLDQGEHGGIANGIGRRIKFERAISFEQKTPASPALMRVRAWSHGPGAHTSVRQRNFSGGSEIQNRSFSRLEDVVNALDRSKSALYASGEGIYGSVVNVHTSFQNIQEVDENNKDEEKPTKQATKEDANCCVTLKTGLFGILDLKLLKNIVFIQFLGMAFVTLAGTALVPVYLPPYAKDNGVSYSKIAIMLSVMAAIDLVSKITSGIIADRKWLRRTTILGTAALATGTMCHLARFFNSFPLIMTMALIMACFYGLYNAMFATILIDIIGMAKFQSSLGFVTLVHGMSIAIFFPVSGFLRDISGSYVLTLHLCGLLSYTGAALLFLLPVVQRRLKTKEEKSTLQSA